MIKLIKKHQAFSLIEISVVIVVIGILIAGISKGVDLYRDFKIKTAQKLTIDSIVPRTTGLAMWLETTMPESFNKNEQSINSKITNWYDINRQSLSKINFAQSTQSSKPTLQISSKNNLPMLFFDGVNDILLSSRFIDRSELTKNGDVTVFMLVDILSYPSVAILFKHSDGGDNRLALECNSNVLRFDYPNPSSGYLAGTNPFKINKNIIISATYNGAVQAIYIDGSLYASKANTNAITKLNSRIAIASNVSPWYFAHANIGEIIIYDRALSNSERQSVESYLAKKWDARLN